MATMTVLGQDQTIQARIEQLREMRLVVVGQITDLQAQLEDREENKARIEGGIIELQALLLPTRPAEGWPMTDPNPIPEIKEQEDTDETDRS